MHTQLHTGQSHIKIINGHHLNLEYIGHNMRNADVDYRTTGT